MTEHYTSPQAVEYLAAAHGIDHLNQNTVWPHLRRLHIEPEPIRQNGRVLHATREQLDRFARLYREKHPNGRENHKPGPGIVVNDNGKHRSRLAPRLPAVLRKARRMQAAHYAAVVARMQRTGEGAYEASTALRMGRP